MPRPHVIYWNSQPSPYVVARFNAVVRNGNVALEAWFDKERDADRSWSVDPAEWEFPATYLSMARIGPYVLPFPSDGLQRRRPDVLVTPMDRKAGAVAALVGRTISRRVAARTLPVYDTWVKRTVVSETANRFLYRSIDGAKVSGRDAQAMSERYGLPRDRSWRVTQSIDLPLYGRSLDIGRQERSRVRRELGVRDCAFIYVGRLDHSKGLNYLIEAFRILQREGSDSTLLILGDGPHEPEIKEVAQGIPNVHFAGFVQSSDLPLWYGISDVFVFPTLGDPNGLVVEEAMAAGLPVVSTTNAGDIRQRVRDGVVGYLVPPFSAEALAERMRELSRSQARRESMGRAAVSVAAHYSMQRYADDFDEFVHGVLSKPARSGFYPRAARVLGRSVLRSARPASHEEDAQ